MPKKQGRAPSCNGTLCGYNFQKGNLPYKLNVKGKLDIDKSTDDDHVNYNEVHNDALDMFHKQSCFFCKNCKNNYGLLISEHAKRTAQHTAQTVTYKPKNKKKN